MEKARIGGGAVNLLQHKYATAQLSWKYKTGARGEGK